MNNTCNIMEWNEIKKKCMNEWMDEWRNEKNEWMNKINAWMNGIKLNEIISNQMKYNKCMNWWMNEWINVWITRINDKWNE